MAAELCQLRQEGLKTPPLPGVRQETAPLVPMPANLTLPQALRRAYASFGAGRFDEVEALCRRIADAKPDHFDALHLLAIARSRLGKTTEALTSYDRALAIRPNSAEALCNRGIA